MSAAEAAACVRAAIDAGVNLVDTAAYYGVPRGSVESHGAWVFDQPFYVILNLATGGNFDGDPASDAIFPATVLVDYVRVYKPTQ